MARGNGMGRLRIERLRAGPIATRRSSVRNVVAVSTATGDGAMLERVVDREIEGFTFRLYDTGRYDKRGCTRLRWLVKAPTGEAVRGVDLCPSILHADDSDETLAALCSFLSSPEVWDEPWEVKIRAFAEEHQEALGMIACELEERDEEAAISW